MKNHTVRGRQLIVRIILAGFTTLTMMSWADMQPGISNVPITQGLNNAFDIDSDGTLDFGLQTTIGSQTDGIVAMGLDAGGVGVFAFDPPFAKPWSFVNGMGYSIRACLK